MKVPKLTYNDVLDALDTEILIASVIGTEIQRKKLIYNPKTAYFTLVKWNGQLMYYSIHQLEKAIEDYNRS